MGFSGSYLDVLINSSVPSAADSKRSSEDAGVVTDCSSRHSSDGDDCRGKDTHNSNNNNDNSNSSSGGCDSLERADKSADKSVPEEPETSGAGDSKDGDPTEGSSASASQVDSALQLSRAPTDEEKEPVSGQHPDTTGNDDDDDGGDDDDDDDDDDDAWNNLPASSPRKEAAGSAKVQQHEPQRDKRGNVKRQAKRHTCQWKAKEPTSAKQQQQQQQQQEGEQSDAEDFFSMVQRFSTKRKTSLSSSQLSDSADTAIPMRRTPTARDLLFETILRFQEARIEDQRFSPLPSVPGSDAASVVSMQSSRDDGEAGGVGKDREQGKVVRHTRSDNGDDNDDEDDDCGGDDGVNSRQRQKQLNPRPHVATQSQGSETPQENEREEDERGEDEQDDEHRGRAAFPAHGVGLEEDDAWEDASWL